jgi:hypothetical protein
MLGIFNINEKINSILNSITLFSKTKKIDLQKLPSLGLFYNDDFSIKIRKATLEDIQQYNRDFQQNVFVVLQNIKEIVNKNAILPSGYETNDIKAIDIMYIFFEIVRYTMDKEDVQVQIKHNKINLLNNFYYFQLPKDKLEKYNEKDKQFVIDGWKFSLPCIGVEQSITKYLFKMEHLGLSNKYLDKSFNFMYFVSDKNNLSETEIENLLTIFNDDMEEEDKEKIDITYYIQ